VHYIDLQLA